MSMATTSINQDAILNWAAAQISSMATGVCENCHKKPKFSTHRYCGKTCAAQAATAQQSAHPAKSRPIAKTRVPPAAPKPARLCDYCGQKPKFGNFDHCGKSCASKATTTAVQPAVQGRSVPKQGARLPATAQIQSGKGSKPAARHVVTTVTKDESSEDDDDEYADADEEDEYDTGSGTDLDAYPSDDDEEPTPAPPIRPVKAAHPSLKSSTPARRVAGICLVPNCGKPSFVEKSGVKADYCSTRHRE
ncbi:hypothetical protein AZE42_07952 [Rhizopogon vesiculosus]|uniref:Uncharacterized protein n=1 Tax=Rhizopogon vesiculosus TaxID=180088 RepID=A0A1J8PTU5_9AGAM|nr:hypothetical protein AZE42_07952 [Rhizopogon vesiculosus]